MDKLNIRMFVLEELKGILTKTMDIYKSTKPIRINKIV